MAICSVAPLFSLKGFPAMNLQNLEAVLFYDKVNVKGLARISLQSKTCEFFSDFVPILPLNSSVTIVAKINGAPFLKITGPVFLSSKKFMRVQPATPMLYEKAEWLFDVPANVNARVVKSHLFSPQSYVPCMIVSCSATSFVLSGNLSPEHGDNKIKLLAGQPIFSESTYVELKYANDGMLFGKNKSGAKYVYNINKINRSSHDELLDYIRQKGVSQLNKGLSKSAVYY